MTVLSASREVYDRCSPGFSSRCTAPLLVDRKMKVAVCNDSGMLLDNLYDIAKIANCRDAIDLKPDELKGEIDNLNQFIYKNVNNAVYRYVWHLVCMEDHRRVHCGPQQLAASYINDCLTHQ
jgi:glutathionyl-hydroquinone reductase